MVELVLLILGVALFFYVLLGGADFGAGVLEIFTGKKSISSISKALAPVWEANHVWLILVIVVVFNGFPKVYSTLSLVLHIPLMAILMGIIFRGTAFTFRHYDVNSNQSKKYYNFFFRLSSVITPFFLGVSLGAMILGRISTDQSLGFYAVFIAPWLNSFCFALGLFTISLFSYLAAVFMLGEVKEETEIAMYRRSIMLTLISSIVLGAFVFLAAEWNGLRLFSAFLNSPLSLGAVLLASLSIPYILVLSKQNKIIPLRIAVAIQTALILIGWAMVQYPTFIAFEDGSSLTIFNTQAPAATFRQLLIALIIGVLLIIPALLYLFRVFKFESK